MAARRLKCTNSRFDPAELQGRGRQAGQSGLPQETVIEVLAESGWSSSWLTGDPVAGAIGIRLGYTAQLIALGGLLSLAIAAVLLFLYGVLISWVTDRPTWLAQVRGGVTAGAGQ